jgi:hypothetical protein
MGVQPAQRGIHGPLLNKDFYGFDRPRALFSNLPMGSFNEFDYMHDFDDFKSAAINLTNDWIDLKTASASAPVLSSEENGAVTLGSQATTDNSACSIQRTMKPFLIKASKKLWFEARVKVSVANDCDMFVGLAETFAADPNNCVVAGTARVGFELVDGSAIIQCSQDNDTATTLTSSGISAVDDTYIRLGFRTDGGSIRYYINRALVATVSLSTAIAAKAMGPAFYGQSGSATGTMTRKMDYFFACQERLT